tara:strand:- start:3776 stop:4546 length:771 start_codon:yes stop_codon:yes gene_type:complete
MVLYSNYPEEELINSVTYFPMSLEDAEHFLLDADLGDGWLHPRASNYTFVMELHSDKGKALAVYKPQLGEAPLWDFPQGSLYLRECATYEFSKALKWGIIPPTIRREGEAGIGSLQLFIPNDPNSNYFTFFEDHKEKLLQLAVLDALLNNADRKGGHCLLATNGEIWAIDNGLTFHVQHKLRTVIWDFAGEAIPHNLVKDMKNVYRNLKKQEEKSIMNCFLTTDEINALLDRLSNYINHPMLPFPMSRKDLPWPVV